MNLQATYGGRRGATAQLAAVLVIAGCAGAADGPGLLGIAAAAAAPTPAVSAPPDTTDARADAADAKVDAARPKAGDAAGAKAAGADVADAATPGAGSAAVACDPMPAPVEDARVIELELDGNHLVDRLIPVECDGRRNCRMAVFLGRGGRCAVARGEVGDATGRGSGVNGGHAGATQALWPLTSHGLALITSDEGLHHSQQTSVWAWNGASWIDIFEYYRRVDVRDSGTETETRAGLTKDAGAACLDPGTPAAAFDIDGDGVRDAIYRVRCRSGLDLEQGCGTWVTRSDGHCRVPIGVLPDGAVTLVQSATDSRPAILRVTGGRGSRGIIEYRFDPQPGGLVFAASRSCAAPQRCDEWVATDPASP